MNAFEKFSILTIFVFLERSWTMWNLKIGSLQAKVCICLHTFASLTSHFLFTYNLYKYWRWIFLDKCTGVWWWHTMFVKKNHQLWEMIPNIFQYFGHWSKLHLSPWSQDLLLMDQNPREHQTESVVLQSNKCPLNDIELTSLKIISATQEYFWLAKRE